jgi:ATP-binding cassette subfamily C (CFTR/MRP) protein 1
MLENTSFKRSDRLLILQVFSNTGLLKDKARVLVTHSINFLPETDYIVLCKGGKIAERGSYTDLIAERGQVYTLMKEYGKRKDDSSNAAAESVESVIGNCADPSAPPLSPLSPKSPMIPGSEKMKSKTTLIQKEESAVGAVSWGVYKGYMESCGIGMVIIYLCLAMLTQIISVGQNVFLADWVRF